MTISSKWLGSGWFWFFIALVVVLGLSFWIFYTIGYRPHRQINEPYIKSSFQNKMARSFALFVAIPCFVLASFSIYFLHIGMHTWFDQRVQTAVHGAQFISQQYFLEQKKSVEHSSETLIQALQNILSTPKNPLIQDFFAPPSPFKWTLSILNSDLTQIMTHHEVLQNISSMIFSASFSLSDQVAVTPHTLSKNGGWLSTLPLKKNWLNKSETGGLYIRLTEDCRHFLSIRPLNPSTHTFLVISHPINPSIIKRVADTNNATNAYSEYLKTQKNWVFISIVIFLTFTVILVLIAMLGGWSFARQTIRPISALIAASEQVRQGQTPLIPIQTLAATSELRHLMSIFNMMSQEVGAKTQALNLANKDLHNRNLFIESVLEGISSAVMSLDPDATIVFFNTRAQKLFPQLNPLKGQNLLLIVPEFSDLFQLAFDNKHIVQSDPITLVRRNQVRTLQLHIQWLESSNTVVVTMDDISSLIAAQKKSAWSDVACRIAHEVKNPLTPIALSAERLRRRYLHEIQNDPKIFQDCIDTIIRQVYHIRDLISEFSDFARLPQARMLDTDLNVMLDQMIALHQQAYPSILFDYKNQPMPIHCDPDQIEQVFNNVLKNAIESIQEMGCKDGRIHIWIEENSDWVIIFIQDNGTGLSSDKSLLLCEPYQTTKAQGMGLGLAIVQKIIDDHRGMFSIQPAPHSTGACVTISLPRKKGAGANGLL